MFGCRERCEHPVDGIAAAIGLPMPMRNRGNACVPRSAANGAQAIVAAGTAVRAQPKAAKWEVQIVADHQDRRRHRDDLALPRLERPARLRFMKVNGFTIG